MEMTENQLIEEKINNRTDELMDLLIRDPDSLCKEDLEKLCEAISRDALSTKDAILNGAYPPQLTNYNIRENVRSMCSDSESSRPVKQSGALGTLISAQPEEIHVKEEYSKGVQKTSVSSAVNMASGDGLPQTSFNYAYRDDQGMVISNPSDARQNMTASGQYGPTDITNHRHEQDTASKRVFSGHIKSNVPIIKIAQPNVAQTVRQNYPIATITSTKGPSQPNHSIGFLVRSANGVTVSCPFERAYQVGESPTTFYAMPTRQMKYTVPCSEQAIATTNWLLENFEENILSTMPRSAMYEEYVRRFSATDKVKHFNQAVFGKMVRACFPNLTTRRLGVRGHSRYHYAGLGVKPTSKYINSLSTRMTTVPRIRNGLKKENRMHLGVAANVTIDSTGDPREANGSQCRDVAGDNFDLPTTFPGVEDLVNISGDTDGESWKVFVTFYCDYNRQLFSYISSLDQDKTKDHLQKFEALCPEECMKLLSYTFVHDVVKVFDGILFTQATASLLPHCMATLSTDFKVSLRKFARAYVDWLPSGIAGYKGHDIFYKTRLESATQWAEHVKRVTTLCHVAKEARKSLKDNAVTKQLRLDLEVIPLEEISLISSWCGSGDSCNGNAVTEGRIARRYMNLLLMMLKGRARLDEYIALIDNIVQDHVFDNHKVTSRCSEVEKQFLMKWSMYSSKILTEITLKSSASVGTFHLLSLLFGDYANHLICSKHDRDALRNVAARVLRPNACQPRNFSTA